MQSFVQSFFQLRFSATEVNLQIALIYAGACAICLGWLVLLSFSLASMLTFSF